MWVKLLKMWQTQTQSRPVAPSRVPEQQTTVPPRYYFARIDHANLLSAYLAINLNLDPAQIRQIRTYVCVCSTLGRRKEFAQKKRNTTTKQKKSKTNLMKRNEIKSNVANEQSRKTKRNRFCP